MNRPSLRSSALAAAGVALLALLALSGRCQASGAPPNAWASHPLWDDGQAEINAYDALEMRYGKTRPYVDYQIVVKEPFSRRLLVKADPDHEPADVFPVLKLNHVIYYQTGVYAYHQMLSFFFDPQDMQPLKWTLTSFEWCGNTFKEFTRRDKQVRLATRTYWDGDADQEYDLPFDRDTVFYDQLPVWLRSQPLDPGAGRTLRVYPTQISSKAPHPQAAPATITVAGREEIALADDSRRSAVLVQVALGDGLHRLWFDAEFPHVLLGWERPDGGRGRLKWTRRLKYWELNQPGDERWLNP